MSELTGTCCNQNNLIWILLLLSLTGNGQCGGNCCNPCQGNDSIWMILLITMVMGQNNCGCGCGCN